MKIIAYFRRDPDQAKAEKGLAIQRQSVGSWIQAQGGMLIAEFIEDEPGGQARPAFGRARKAAVADDAVLLVATTKAMAGGERFSPYGSMEPRIVCLRDPQELEWEAWSRSRLIVLYRRVRASTHDSDRVQAWFQQDAIASLIHPDLHTVVAEFVEVEPLSADGHRPALVAALALCREKQARLIIGTRDPIGGGEAFDPAFTDVPYEVAYRAADRWYDLLPAPESTAAMPVAIHLGDHQVRNRLPVYLVNRTGGGLFNITVTRSGWTLSFDGVAEMVPAVTEIGWIDDGLGWLVGSYELAFDSDFTVSWSVTAKDASGRTWAGSATLDKGQPTARSLALVGWHPTEPTEVT